MNGRILDYSIQDNTGVISGDDGSRYYFTGSQWKEAVVPARGMMVDFEVDGANAIGIYRAIGASGAAVGREKNKVAAGLFALLLGGFGVHKFYLGYTMPAILMLVIFLVGIPLMFIGIGFLMVSAIGVIALIEGIIYLTKSDEVLDQIR